MNIISYLIQPLHSKVQYEYVSFRTKVIELALQNLKNMLFLRAIWIYLSNAITIYIYIYIYTASDIYYRGNCPKKDF